MSFNTIIDNVRRYYDAKIFTHGTTPKGVDWNSAESQELRFEQLLKVCDATEPFTIIDYGCGYGALVEFMADRGYAFQYRGYDISEHMIAKAKELYSNSEYDASFVDESFLEQADYTVASGIFNVKLQIDDEEWKVYLLKSLERINELSKKGFAFNVLTKYSDREFMRPDLYYADPLFLFDYCKRHFSGFVSLLHDYPLYEFTILVKK